MSTESFSTKKEKLSWKMGIDEAGRGPVLGPMVYGCCVWPVENEDEMKAEGFFDSKQLSEADRERLFGRMEALKNDKLYFEVRILSARFLSNRMLAK
jgi:ribonuclease H2 subunit A